MSSTRTHITTIKGADETNNRESLFFRIYFFSLLFYWIYFVLFNWKCDKSRLPVHDSAFSERSKTERNFRYFLSANLSYIFDLFEIAWITDLLIDKISLLFAPSNSKIFFYPKRRVFLVHPNRSNNILLDEFLVDTGRI